MAVRDGERFLGEAIESALAQRYEPIEIVVVDDGSTDGTPDVIARYREVRALRQENTGPGAARNAGIRAAEGELIAFLDADDLLPPTKLSTQVAHLQDHPGDGIVLGRQELRFEDGVTVPRWTARPDWVPWDIEWDGREQIPVMTMVARRSVFEQVGLFDTTFRICEDFDWVLRVHDSGIGIGIVDGTVLIRRVHSTNLTNDTATVDREMFRVLRNRMARARSSR